MSIRTSRNTLVAGSAIALLLLTGTAAAGTAFIDGAKLKPSSVTSKKIKNGTLTASDVKAGTLSGAQIADGSISGADINGTVTAANISGKVNDADKLDGKDSSEFITRAELIPVAIRLNAGDVKVLATNGPVRLLARCAENEGGQDVVEILAETTTSNAFLEGDSDLDGGPLPADFLQPGTPAANRAVLRNNLTTSVTPHSENDIDDGYVLAASGEYLGLDGESTALNFNVAGSKCSVITSITANHL